MDKKAGITAYDSLNRVKVYDKEMDIMHPNRAKMVNIALDFLPFNSNQDLKVLDLGFGTGFFTKLFLEKFPKSKLIAIDGAECMVDCAKARLENLAKNITFKVGDFRFLKDIIKESNSFDIIITSFALHHLTVEEKLITLKDIFDLLKPNGYFINADIVISSSKMIEDKFQDLRVKGILERSVNSIDPKYKDYKSVREYLDNLEKNEKDNPLTLSLDLDLLEKSGFKKIDILWKEYREVVTCAIK